MRKVLLLILVSIIFVAWSAIARAEEGGTFLKGGVSMEDSVDTETQAMLDAEDSRHDGKMTALDSKGRDLEEAHESEMEAIDEQENLKGDAKARVKADKTAWHEKKMRDIDRERGLEEKVHKKRMGEILAKGKKLLSDAASAVSDALQSGGERSRGAAPPQSTGAWPDTSTGPADEFDGAPESQQAEQQQAQRQQQEQQRKQQQQAKALEEAKRKESERAKKQAAERARQEQRKQAEQQQAQQRAEQQAKALERAGREEAPVEDSSGHEVPEKWGDKSIPGRMMKLANEMDRIAADMQNDAMEAGEEFSKGVGRGIKRMSDSVAQTAKVFAQKPGTVLPKMAEDLITYLSNDYNENNQMMYDDAVRAVDEMQKNPAGFFGEHAIEMAASAVGGAGQLGAIRKAGQAGKMGQVGRGLAPSRPSPPPRPAPMPSPQRVTPPPPRPSSPPARPAYTPPARPSYTPPPRPAPAPPRRPSSEPQRQQQRSNASDKLRKQEAMKRQKQQVKDLEKAGKTLKGMAENAREFSGFDITGSGGLDLSKVLPAAPGSKSPVNIARAIDKTAGNENCFSVSMGAAARWKTGRPYVALDHNIHTPLYDPTTNKYVYGDVGTRNAKITEVLKRKFGGEKAKYPFHGELEAFKCQQEGIPVVSNERKIRKALGIAGKDSQGLVFVDGGKGTPGHVFNVRNNNGTIEFWDFQEEPPIQILSFRNGKVVAKRGGKSAVLPLEWKRTFFYRLD